MATDEAVILAVHQGYAAAWSAGDAERAATFFTDDSLRVGAAGDVQHGPEGVKTALGKLFQGPFKGATMKIEPGSVRMLSAQLAVLHAPMQIETGNGKPPLRGIAADVVKKVAGKWLIVESHPKLFPPKR